MTKKLQFGLGQGWSCTKSGDNGMDAAIASDVLQETSACHRAVGA